jgi:hypothetical protein
MGLGCDPSYSCPWIRSASVWAKSLSYPQDSWKAKEIVKAKNEALSSLGPRACFINLHKNLVQVEKRGLWSPLHNTHWIFLPSNITRKNMKKKKKEAVSNNHTFWIFFFYPYPKKKKKKRKKKRGPCIIFVKYILMSSEQLINLKNYMSKNLIFQKVI